MEVRSAGGTCARQDQESRGVNVGWDVTDRSWVARALVTAWAGDPTACSLTWRLLTRIDARCWASGSKAHARDSRYARRILAGSLPRESNEHIGRR